MSHRLLSDHLSLTGEWWLPEAPGRRIAGRLEYGPERAELALNESFIPPRGDISVVDPPARYPAIFGNTTSGEFVTVWDAQRIGVSFNFGSGGLRQPERVLSGWLLVGALVSPGHAFRRVAFRIPGLEVWLSIPNIQQTLTHFPDTSDLSQTFTFGSKPGEVASLPSIDARLKFGTEYSSRSNQYKEISVQVSAWATFEPTSPQPLPWFLEQYGKLSTMLTFLSGTSMPADCIEASPDESTHRIGVLVQLKHSDVCTLDQPSDFFMPRSALGKPLEQVVATWFAKVPAVLTPSQLAQSVLSSDLWLHVEFLSLMQALEGFHRSLFPGKYTSDEEYEPIKAALTSSIPPHVSPDHRDALRSRIRYGNQISLRKRLDELVGMLPEKLTQLLVGRSGSIPRSWIDTRNYYTHWDSELLPNVLEGQDMYFANVRMRHLLRVLYINLMEIPPEATTSCFSNTSGASQQLLQLNLIDHKKLYPSDSAGVVLTITEKSGGTDDLQSSTETPTGDQGSTLTNGE
jgi:hypothetical protein